MKISGICDNNQRNSNSQLSFKAKIVEVNPYAKKILLNLDERFGKVLDNKSEDIKAIKLGNLPVNISLSGYNEPDMVSIVARLDGKLHAFGNSDFFIKPGLAESNKSYDDFIAGIQTAVKRIGSSEEYLSALMSGTVEKVNSKNSVGTHINTLMSQLKNFFIL